MELKYKSVRSMSKPSEIEFSEGYVYLRKDMTSETISYDDGREVEKWTYQEACLTEDEYKAYEASNVGQLMTGQNTADDNQLTIMEAIADLYDVIASMM